MADVFWLEQTEADVPGENDWLTPGEFLRLNNLRFAKRRSDWRLGRWTAKRALAICLNLPDDGQSLAKIEIRAAPSGEPESFLNQQPSGSTISLSHSSGRALCAVAPAKVALGCDVERIESRSDSFVVDYFTAEERAQIARSPAAERSLLVTLLWSAKESALKALHAGLRLDTRSVVVNIGNVSPGGDAWHHLRVRKTDDREFHGWWQSCSDFVRTLVSAPPPDRPVHLQSRNWALSAAGEGDRQTAGKLPALHS
jgi:4'-phosphopantetheinyl transferase